MDSDISGIILAGGAGRRFRGIIKANLIVDGKPIIRRILDVIGPIFDEIIIVTNTPEEYRSYTQYRITGDVIKNIGPLGGIHAGIKSSTKNAVFVIAGDMPFPDKELIENQIKYYRENRCEILIPRVGGNIEPLHGIYHRSVLSMIETHLAEGRGHAVKDFIKNVNVSYMSVPASPSVIRSFSNVNTPGDLEHLLKPR